MFTYSAFGSVLFLTVSAWSPATYPVVPRLSVDYVLRVDPARDSVVDVRMHIHNAPGTLHLAMKVHPEYDAKYWRYLDSVRVDGSADDHAAAVTRVDNTLWSVILPGGRGVVHYRVRIQTTTGTVRRAWQPFMRPTGGLINGPDFFLYLPEFTSTPVSVTLQIPHGWRIATALELTNSAGRFMAPDAATLLDSPILVGDLREWSFSDRGMRFHVVYWPLPEPATFDTVALVDEVRRLAGVTLNLFGRLPGRAFHFLLQDGASDALEHRASVTLGIASAALARDPHASLTELAHEFFHAWNLVAIHPDTYGELSYRPAPPTTGLWWGEGVTLFYADALSRRAGLPAADGSRLDHLARLLARYYAAPWRTSVSPERASLAFGDSPVTNSDATGSYYLQGELLGNELDALIRAATADARSLDDVMRALFAASTGGTGFTSSGLQRLTDSVCACRLTRVFADQVRASALIDATPVLARLGLRVVVDSAAVTDSLGMPMPDGRVGIDLSGTVGALRLVLRDPTSVWSGSGLRTGDVLIAINGTAVGTATDFRRTLRALRVGDVVRVDVLRDDRPLRMAVRLAGYRLPRVRFMEIDSVTAEQRARRERWLDGW
ncbi:MAG: PDZ domain-containing protein [Gemmatimonadaceae bacterium]